MPARVVVFVVVAAAEAASPIHGKALRDRPAVRNSRHPAAAAVVAAVVRPEEEIPWSSQVPHPSCHLPYLLLLLLLFGRWFQEAEWKQWWHWLLAQEIPPPLQVAALLRVLLLRAVP